MQSRVIVPLLALGLAISAPVLAQKPGKKAKAPATPAKTSPAPAAKTPSPTLITVGPTQVPADEFVYVYKKNNDKAPDAFSEKSLREYLDLYLKFKLKVQDAFQNGLDTTSSFKKELETYRKQLAQPYLSEKSVSEKLIKEAYERMKQEVNAAHILIMVASDADPKDTLKAYNKIEALRKRALAGEDFAKLAKENSDDKVSAQQSGGGLGYFSALQMVYPFEDAAYKTPVGQISPIVRTQFGYHVLKVNAKRPSQGQVKVAHLMVRTNPGQPAEDSIAAKNKIDSLYNKVKSGGDWNSLVSQFSDDAATKDKGGELQMFSTGQMIPSFEEVAFGLKTTGEISKPFQTPYGWHIAKLLEKKPLESYEELEPTIKQKVSRDSRSQLNSSAFLARIKKENNLVENKAVVNQALGKGDTSLASGRWTYSSTDKLLTQTLFTIAGKAYPVKGFFDFVAKTQQQRNNKEVRYLMELAYKAYVDQELLAYEEAHLEEKHEDYRMLVKEYREGILLFTLMDQKVWTKAVDDTAGLRKYFDANKAKYQWKERVKATVYNCASEATLAELKKKLAEKVFPAEFPKYEDIAFEKSSDKTGSQGTSTLRYVADNLKRDKTLLVQIGAELSKGEKSSLAKKRQQAVYDSLIRRGVNKSQIVLVDLSKNKPAEVAATDFGKVKLTSLTTYTKVLEKQFNKDNALNVQIREGKFQRGDDATVDKFPVKKGEYTEKIGDRVVYVVVEDVLPAGPKSLDEARGLAISDYQTELENAWVKELQAKYPTQVNEAEFAKLIKK